MLGDGAFANVNCPAQRDCVLVAEADHRLLNNLQTVASLLSLQSGRCSSQEGAAQLASAAARVMSLQRVHRQLHSFEPGRTVAFKAFLEGLCAEFAVALSPNGTMRSMLSVRGVEMHLPARTAAALAFIANELITNASKYGEGAIVVDLATSASGRCVLSVSNDGPSLPDAFDVSQSTGLGMMIVQAFAAQVGGALTVERGGPASGPTFKINFPSAKDSSERVIP